MFWKRPKIRLLLSLFAALLLAGGLCLADAGSSRHPEAWQGTTFPLQSWTAFDNYTQAESIGLPASGSTPNTPGLRPYLAAGLLSLGGVLALFLVITGSMAKPRLGTDLCLWLLGLAWLLFFYLLHTDSGISLAMCFPLFWLCILSLEELAAWVRAGFSRFWWNSHRVGMTSGMKWYVFILGLWSILCLVLGAALASLSPAAIPLGAMFLVSAIAALYSLARFGPDLEQLLQQIAAASQGKAPGIQSQTAFAASQQQLRDMHLAQKQAIAAAVASERFRVDLIANVSHDLRTPLTAILGYGELLEKQPMSPEALTELRKLNGKAAYMKDLVDSLFELTKVSSGAEPAKRESIDLIRLLEQTLGLYHDLLEDADLQVRRHYCSQSLSLRTDGSRLHQVFANLVGNAVKYALPGSRVHLHVEDQNVSVSIRLTNIARYEMDFAPEDILQRFARGDKARTTPGSGLGLAIAQTYTESLGGRFAIAIDGEQFSAMVTLPKN